MPIERFRKPGDSISSFSISVGGLFGNLRSCVGKLRRTVRPGGYILIDDGFFKTGHKVDRMGYEHYASHADTLEFLAAHGEKIFREVLHSDAETASINRRYLVSIKKKSSGSRRKTSCVDRTSA